MSTAIAQASLAKKASVSAMENIAVLSNKACAIAVLIIII